MTKYPLTYAVLYRSLIEPFTQLNQYDINHILFAGNIGIDETHPDYISRVLGNGYVSGNKTIQKEFTKRIAMLTPSELVSRIHSKEPLTPILVILSSWKPSYKFSQVPFPVLEFSSAPVSDMYVPFDELCHNMRQTPQI